MSRDIPRNGDCYEAAAKMMMGDTIFRYSGRLVHGNVTGQGPIKGIRHGHAWVEVDDIVFDNSNGKSVMMRRERYYEIGKIKNPKRYTFAEMRGYLLSTCHYGPWRKPPTKKGN